VDEHRIATARLLAEALREAREAGIPIPYGGWYPGTGNIGWGYSLTLERKNADCDRAGLVDLTRQQDGVLKRVLCSDLVKEVIGLRDIFTGVTPHYPRMPVEAHAMALSASGD
jgi:hypothetical protein